ncbi:MAG TPA: ORF6N domain-containing protein [bacterium]|nr:ORF6N domain-containing protein [bacterium]
MIKLDDIKSRIFTIRGMQVMLDSDLAELYGVETKRLNEQVRRNIERFPDEFGFVLSRSEYNFIRSHFATIEIGQGKHKKYLPRVFTEYGVMMLSNVLKSETASKVSINIIKAFVSLRRYLKETSEIFQRFEIIEKRQIKYELETDNKIEKVLNALENRQLQPKQGIFFNGQIFDAHKFVSDLVRSAEKSIVLIDNYIDDTVLTLFAKRKSGVTLKILTKNVTKQLQLDMKKFNEQFPPAEIQEFDQSHDRFMIIDSCVVYHIGASLKDLGKKWFAFSKMDITVADILRKL